MSPGRTVRRRTGKERLRRPSSRTAGLSLMTALLLAAGCGEEEVERPTPLFDEVPVEYPLELWDGEVEGTTVIRLRVDVEGGVDSAVVAEPSGYAAFDSAAVRGGRELRFRPARRDGEPVPVWAEVPVHFSRDSIE